MQKRRVQPLLGGIVVLLCAAVLRIPGSGSYVLWVDEYSIDLAAYAIAFEGDRPLVGATAKFPGLTHHSPLTTYMLGFFVRAVPNPHATRVFVALLGLVTLAIWYKLVWRYFDWQVALVTGLMLAILPTAVHWHRFVWNPNIGQFAIPLWLLTALLAVQDGRRAALPLHWLSLSVNIQAQSALLYLLPVSMLVTGLALWRAPGRRAMTGAIAFTSVGLFLLTLLPWWVGLRAVSAEVGSQQTGLIGGFVANLAFLQVDWGILVGLVGSLWGATDFPRVWLNWHPQAEGIWTVLPLNALGWLQVLIVVVGFGLLTIAGWRQRERRAVYALLVGMGIVPFGLLLFTSRAFQGFIGSHYFMPTTFVATLAFAYAVVGLWRGIARRYRPLVVVVTVGIYISHMVLIGAFVRFLDAEAHVHPTGNLDRLAREAEAILQHGDSMVLLWEDEAVARLPDATRFAWFDLYQSWRVMRWRYLIDFLEIAPDATSVALRQGRVYVGMPTSAFMPSVFANPIRMGQTVDGPGRYQLATATVPALRITARPATATEFAGIARVWGVRADPKCAQEPEQTIAIVWEPLVSGPDERYHLSVRLVDAAGRQHHQEDFALLRREAWQRQQLVLTSVSVPALDEDVGSVAMQLVLYTLPDAAPVVVAGDPGQPQRYDVVIPDVCDAA